MTTHTAPDTGKAIRDALRATFPGVKFSVRGSRGTGYGWFTVTWTDGPTEDAVRAVTNPIHVRQRFIGGVNHTRHYSPAALEWAQAQVDAHPARWYRLTDDEASAEHVAYIRPQRVLLETDFREVNL